MDMFDEAHAIESTMRLCNLTQNELAARLGVSQSYVANKLRLLSFSRKMTEKIKAAGITERHARSLLRLGDEAEAERILDEVSARSLTVRECEALVDAALMRAIPALLAIKAEASRASTAADSYSDLSLSEREHDRERNRAQLPRHTKPDIESRASALDRIADLREAIAGGCEFLRSQGIDARTRSNYLGQDLYITVVVKNA